MINAESDRLLVDEMQDWKRRGQVRTSVATLLAEAGQLQQVELLLAEVDDAAEKRTIRTVAAVAAATTRGNFEAAEALLESVSPPPLAWVAFYSAAAVWLKHHARQQAADDYAARVSTWSTQVTPFEPNRELRTKVRFLTRLASNLMAAGRHAAAKQFRAEAAQAAEAASGTFVPIILAELVPDHSAADADQASSVFDRVRETLTSINDEEQREVARIVKEIYAERGWADELAKDPEEFARPPCSFPVQRIRRGA